MIEEYPLTTAPDAQEWLELTDEERLGLVEYAHEGTSGGTGEHPRMHAKMHVAVENQIAAGTPSFVGPAVERLRQEGLDRHEAIHAIASAFARELQRVLRSNGARMDDERYRASLAAMTAEEWRRIMQTRRNTSH